MKTLKILAGLLLASLGAFAQTLIDDSFGAQGTAGAGFYQVANQSSAPGAATGAIRLYANSANILAIKDASNNIFSFGPTSLTFASTGTTITGGAGNMTITAGTGNSRTLALQSTTAGGTATTFLTGNADQSTTLGGNLTMSDTLTGAATLTGTNIITSAAGQNLTLRTGTFGTALTVVSATGAAHFADGTAAAPSVSFASRTGDGFYTGGLGRIILSGQGSASIAFLDGGRILNANVDGGLLIPPDGSVNLVAGGTNKSITLTPSGTGSTLFGGNVGIGTTNPGAKLDVNGTGKFADNLLRFATTKGIQGSNTNDDVAGGYVGEYVSSLVAAGGAVSLTTNTAANVTSITLTAGDWDVEAHVNLTAGTATVSQEWASMGTTSATLATDGSEAYSSVQTVTASAIDSVTPSRKRFSLSGTNTVYLVGKATFSTGTVGAFGQITARRVR